MPVTIEQLVNDYRKQGMELRKASDGKYYTVPLNFGWEKNPSARTTRPRFAAMKRARH